MTRSWFDRPLPAMPSREDIDRHTDEAYERGIQREIDAEAEAERHAKHAEKRKVIPERDEDERRGEE